MTKNCVADGNIVGGRVMLIRFNSRENIRSCRVSILVQYGFVAVSCRVVVAVVFRLWHVGWLSTGRWKCSSIEDQTCSLVEVDVEEIGKRHVKVCEDDGE